MTGRILSFCLFGAAFGMLVMCLGEDPRSWFGYSIAAFLAAIATALFEENRSPILIVLALVYAAAGSWVFFHSFLTT